MNTTELATVQDTRLLAEEKLREAAAAIMEKLIIAGDLSQLSPTESINFYNATCQSLGLNPLTRPFEYLVLQGKKVMYARKDCAEQLRRIYSISTEIEETKFENGLFIAVARATTPSGRVDEDFGAVPCAEKAAPEFRANALKKAITSAKRRVTLSICGLGFMDEGDVDDAQAAEIQKSKRKGAVKTITSATSGTGDAGGAPPDATRDAPSAVEPQTEAAAVAASGGGATENAAQFVGAEKTDAVGGETLPPDKIPPQKITDRSNDDWDEVLRQAANTGDMKKLEGVWLTIPPSQQKFLRAAMERRHKPNCQEAAAKVKGHG